MATTSTTKTQTEVVDLLTDIKNNVIYSWNILDGGLESKKSVGDLQDYVVTVHWRYGATYKNSFEEEYGVYTFTEKEQDPEGFTPFSELTIDIIGSWLEAELSNPDLGHNSLEQIRERLCVALEAKLNPKIERPKLPWAE